MAVFAPLLMCMNHSQGRHARRPWKDCDYCEQRCNQCTVDYIPYNMNLHHNSHTGITDAGRAFPVDEDLPAGAVRAFAAGNKSLGN